MKRLNTMMIVAVAFATVTQAEFIIDFYSSFGIYNADGTGGLLPNTGDIATLQLVYAGANGVADTDSSNSVAITGDDELIWTGTFVNNGGLYEDYASAKYDVIVANYRGTGLIYGQISTDATGILSYYTGHIQQMFDRDPSIIFTPDVYDLGQGLDNQLVTVVPEPITLGLLGVASVGLYLVRQKRRGIPMVRKYTEQFWRRS